MKINEEYVRNRVKNGERLDDRDFNEFRDIEIIPNYIRDSAEGSALVKIGDTQVLAGIKLETGTPYPDSPNEGVLRTGAEFVPLASPEFESGPPSKEATEFGRVIDRGIRESAMIDLEDLVIEEGEKVWMVNIDLHIIDDNGNIFDAAALAATAALLTAEIPVYDEDEEMVDRDEMDRDLAINKVPITVTGRMINNTLLFDTTTEEEEAVDSRLTVTLTEDGNVVSIQKGGSTPVSMDNVGDIIDAAQEHAEAFRSSVNDAVN